ncbi:MAG: YcxB family protein [Oscillospiraceae bacterium]|nr:YcxB family protein [Oscillospiraceae bacterium]
MAKAKFTVTMKHDEDTLVALSHMQYDLFCNRNRVARGAVAALVIVIAVLYGGGSWWSLLLIAYGCYLLTSTYASSNRTAHKIADQLKAAHLPFPSSVYRFESSAMTVMSLPDQEEITPLPYGKILQLGEDAKAFYIFRDQYGGYMIPKAELKDRQEEFRRFLEGKTGKVFIRRWTPLRRLKSWLRQRENEPPHL